jgi:heat shock protein HtpX
MALQMAFGILASMIVAWFSRRREFRADAGGASLESPAAMASALNRLRAMRDAPSQLPDNLTAFGIRGEGMLKLMATHPPLEERIARLQGQL